ncbi:MAG TPA: D-sedoheptulose 7-phosphate isomerase [Ignavibacteriaceae bacterium]|nr:D-sedoheptulose 7-phosphate isomerase [Ignavibacteriaceae bacterium]
MEEIIKHFKNAMEIKRSIIENPEIINKIKNSASIILDAYKSGFKTLIAGNGGSAADAQHMAGEFVSKFNFDRPGLASVALTTDSSIITAIGNDYGYEKVFARQIEAQGNTGDIFIGISTSGNSKNILEAIRKCNEKNIFTIGFTGESGGEMAHLCNICIQVPSNETPRIQEVHLLIEHIICGIVEENMFKEYKK